MNRYSSWERGTLSERLVAAALSKLRGKGVIEDYVCLLLDSGELVSDLEAKGVDCIVVKGGLGLPLQVKTSRKKAAEHRKIHKDIPVVIVGRSQELSIAEEKTRVVISDAPDTLWQEKWYDLYLLLISPVQRRSLRL